MEPSDYSKEAPLPKIETTHLPKEHTNVSEPSTEAVTAVESEAENLDEPGSSDASAAAAAAAKEEEAAECTRERLKRHRREMGGQVWIPEMWGQESLLKDWVDCAAFDSSLVPAGLVSAREALVSECRRQTSARPLQIQNRCGSSLYMIVADS
ncbi:hypothetical protein ACMD2_11670 [Ananas comosus]|uniref:Protein BIC1 n=1 Tax=Ananas comosus TaxID=4615 RepID=A0A199V3Y6_ANACO|nr:hypothetical protein ACMD2_11670 [Ananas comosus]